MACGSTQCSDVLDINDWSTGISDRTSVHGIYLMGVQHGLKFLMRTIGKEVKELYNSG